MTEENNNDDYRSRCHLLVREIHDSVQELSKNKPKLLYHYTSSHGITGIIRTGSIWATHSDYLNDKSETKYASELIVAHLRGRIDEENHPLSKELINNIINDHNFRHLGYDPYISCFCEDGDLLSQWHGYGSLGQGFSIGLSAINIEEDPSESGSNKDFSLHKIIYNQYQQESIIKEITEKYLASFLNEIRMAATSDHRNIIDQYHHSFKSAIALVLITFKHPAFSQEREWRAISIIPDDQIKNEVKFRTTHNKIIPYHDLDISTKASPNPGKIPLVDIIVGPTNQYDLSEQSILILLASKGYETVNINPSSIPLR